jgi:acyl carrier protein
MIRRRFIVTPTSQPIALSIANTVNKSIQPGSGWQFPIAGTVSDFEWWVFAGLAAVAFSLCALNYFFLRRYEVSRQQMESDRRYEIHRQSRSVAAYRFPCWVRIVGNLACKIGFVLLAYGLVSAQDRIEVWAGLIAALGFIGFNSRCVLREVLHPRSVLHRRFLFYRADPTFIRTRLFFELIRRFVYFIIGLAFLSYALHRLTGNEYVFTTHKENISLFLQHLESALSGMTSFGSDPLAYTNNLGIMFHFFRTLFAFILFVAFANLMISGMSSSGHATEGQIPSRICRQESGDGLDTKNDVAAMVGLVIEAQLGTPSIQIKPESDLIRDLGADSLDMIELQLNLEQAFECEAIQPSIIMKKTKVGELIDFFWEMTQKEASTDEIGVA